MSGLRRFDRPALLAVASALLLMGVALVAAGLAWLADRPGELTVDWQGYVIETSVFRAIVLTFALVVATLVGLLFALFGRPYLPIVLLFAVILMIVLHRLIE